MKIYQKTVFAVRSNDVSFYVTAKQIKHGVGTSCSFNTAVYDALQFLQGKNKTEDVRGVLGSFNGRSIQLDIVE